MPAKANNPKTEATDEKLDAAFGPVEVNVAPFVKSIQEAVTLPEAEPEAQGPAIFRSLLRVMRAVTYVGKSGFNEQQRYNFRGIDATVNALGPAMREHGVLAVPTLLATEYRDAQTTQGKPTREVTVQVKYTFYAADGSYIEAVVPGESLDQSDKGSAKAMSVAFRIALLQVFALPTDEPDPDASYHTRDGVGAMTPSVRDMLLVLVPGTLAEGLGPLWAVVLEHSAAERRIGDADITWADYFGQRIAEIIEGIETWDEGVAVKRALEAQQLNFLRYQDIPADVLLTKRSVFIKERATKAFDCHVQAIGNATALEELDIANEGMEISYLTNEITTKQKIALLDIIGDKRAKLERELHVAELPEDESSIRSTEDVDALDELAAAGGLATITEPSGANDDEGEAR